MPRVILRLAKLFLSRWAADRVETARAVLRVITNSSRGWGARVVAPPGRGNLL